MRRMGAGQPANATPWPLPSSPLDAERVEPAPMSPSLSRPNARLVGKKGDASSPVRARSAVVMLMTDQTRGDLAVPESGAAAVPAPAPAG